MCVCARNEKRRVYGRERERERWGRGLCRPDRSKCKRVNRDTQVGRFAADNTDTLTDTKTQGNQYCNKCHGYITPSSGKAGSNHQHGASSNTFSSQHGTSSNTFSSQHCASSNIHSAVSIIPAVAHIQQSASYQQ